MAYMPYCLQSACFFNHGYKEMETKTGHKEDFVTDTFGCCFLCHLSQANASTDQIPGPEPDIADLFS